MSEENNGKIRDALGRAIPPVADRELKRDLWPQMLRKLDRQAIRVPWYDWALAALLVVWLYLIPEAILALVYQL